MSHIKFTEFLVKSLVEREDLVSVKEGEMVEDSLLINVYVAEDDLGRIIGKRGRTANSIRTVVQASFHEDFKRVKIEFQSYE